MRHTPSTAHIPPEALVDYFYGAETRLPEERESAIEEHLAECTQCTEEARQLHAFTGLLHRWTAQAHGQAYRQATLLRGLKRAGDSEGRAGIRARLEQWRQHLASRAGAAIRVVMEAGEDVSRLITEGLEALVTPPLQPAPVRIRGAVRTRGTARTTLTPEQPQACVEIHGRRGEVIVRVEKLPPEQPSPLVLLMPTSAEGQPIVRELQRQESGVHEARFVDVAPGDYLVAFEPAT
jgi:hypothetical protein